MKKISSAIMDIVEKNDFLLFGMQSGLLNLSKTAAYIRPFIESRTKKEVKESAVLMGLSRMNKEVAKIKKKKANTSWIVNFTIRTNLCSYAFFNTAAFRHQLAELFPAFRGLKCYFTQSQGINEYSITIDQAQSHLVEKFIKEKPKSARCGLTSLNIELHENWYDTVGVISGILQKIAFQGISIHEISSTFNELIFCVDQKDLKITVDTLCAMNDLDGAEK